MNTIQHLKTACFYRIRGHISTTTP